MNRIRWTALFGLAAVAGCASLQGSDGPDPQTRLTRALEALEQQNFRGAYEELALIYGSHHAKPVGQRALLAMAAVELDPRNGGRRLDVGADLAARHFQLAGAPEWTTPVSQTLYLLALELGAAEERAARAEAEKEDAQRAAAQAEEEKQQAEEEKQKAQAEAQRARAVSRAATAKAARAEAQARTAARAPRPLPRYSGTSVSARVRSLSGERDRLQDEVQSLKRRLAEREQELERIRATLVPRG